MIQLHPFMAKVLYLQHLLTLFSNFNMIQFLPGALSDRILKEARAQQEEIDAGVAADASGAATYRGLLAAAMPGGHASDSDDDDALSGGSDWEGEDWDAEMAAEDEAALAAFMAPGADQYQQRTLTDMIMDRIKQRQSDEGDVAVKTPK